MANIKNVRICGIAPFNLNEHVPLQPLLSFLISPTSGIRLNWTGYDGSLPNSHGGKTAMYRFELVGEEGVSWGWLKKFKEEIREICGTILIDDTVDIEG